MHKKILYIVSEDWYFLSHRLSLALEAKKKGYSVNVLCGDTGKISEIKGYGINCYELISTRSSTSIIALFKEVFNIRTVVKNLNPSIVHLVAFRSILVGLLSLITQNKLKIIVSITGLGSIFLSKKIKVKLFKLLIVCFLFINFKKNNIKIIVQNKDDYNFCLYKLHCNLKKLFIIRGSGVNIKHFEVHKEPKSPPIILTYVGRLIKDKGIEVLINAFEKVSKNNKNIKLLIAGKIDYLNPSAITENYLNIKLNENKNIIWLGEVLEIKKLWQRSHIAVLASRREGLPKSLLEAAASGKPIIATDVPGCREIAINGVNAITFPLDDEEELIKAIRILSENDKMRIKYGLKSREIVEKDMSEEIIINKTISIYKNSI